MALRKPCAEAVPIMTSVRISMLSDLRLWHDGVPVELPASKRTRALLAYLTLTARPHRRDRLCEVFWTVPDDPRGALRWALTKIRPLVNPPAGERLIADRERVRLVSDDIEIDVRRIASELKSGGLGVDRLMAMCESLQLPLLDGLELPDQPLFQNWLVSERQDAGRLRATALRRLATHEDLPVDRALGWSEAWMEAEPYSPDAATQLLTHYDKLGETGRLQNAARDLRERFRKADIPWSPSARTDGGSRSHGVSRSNESRRLLARQRVQFCTADDGARLAYATVGEGPPIVKAANWLSHLELDWDAPVWSPLFRELARAHNFVRYDERGNGLSDWDVSDISFSAFVTDLETVVDATGLEKFALLGISQGAAVSIEYAVRYPERVSHLILFGGYAAGWRINATPDEIKEREAVMTLTATGWGKDNPAYRQIFSSTFMPSATADELSWFNEFQRQTTSPENAVRFLSAFGDIDVRHRLNEVAVPTLVIHSLGDRRIPVEVGRDIAASIPGAQFLGLESDGHLLLGHDNASSVFVDAVRRFVGETGH